MMKKENKSFTVIILLALIIRIVYVLYTPYYIRQHDVGTLDSYGYGISYIETIYNTGNLPTDNYGQHYHPPLHPILSAIWLKMLSIFISDVNLRYEGLQFLMIIYSIAIIFITHKILLELNVSNKARQAILYIMAFHPTLIILSGSINNDMLCFMLMMLTLFRLIIWYKESSYKNTIFLAIVTGLSVMTKTTGALLAFPIMFIFLFKFISEWKKIKNKKTIKKYLRIFTLFGLISLPIGLWYNIRNLILFKQPIMYILEIPNELCYTGNVSLFYRLNLFSKELLDPFALTDRDVNIPAYVLKSSLFGEWSWNYFGIYKILYFIVIFCNILLTIYTFVSIFQCLFRKKQDNKLYLWMLLFLFIFNVVSFLGMNIKLPYGFSMDFRYLLTLLPIGAIFVYANIESIIKNNKYLGNYIYGMVNFLTTILLIFTNLIIFTSIIE